MLCLCLYLFLDRCLRVLCLCLVMLLLVALFACAVVHAVRCRAVSALFVDVAVVFAVSFRDRCEFVLPCWLFAVLYVLYVVVFNVSCVRLRVVVFSCFCVMLLSSVVVL